MSTHGGDISKCTCPSPCVCVGRESGVLGSQLVFYYIFTTEGSTITLLINASKASLGQP